MKDTTLLKWLYVLELTAPVFYRVKSKFIKDPEEKKIFKHFEENELPHSPMIKDFLRKNNNIGVFPFPDFIIELGAAIFSFLIALFGKKMIYAFEYHFENKAVHVYTKLANNTKDPEIKKFAQQLCEEEVPHLNFFKEKLGIK